jgi:ATP phosphoribosyltransferase regulatory subunit
VLEAARQTLPQRALISEALDQLQWLASHLQQAFPALRIGFDLSDMSGYAYYSGPRFAIYGKGSSDALARGGRYDEVGRDLRPQPPCGRLQPGSEVAGRGCRAFNGAGRHPGALGRGCWPARRRAAAARGRRDRAVRLPGQAAPPAAFACDRELICVEGRWLLRALNT